MLQKEDDWSPNPFWATLYIILKSLDLKFFYFSDNLPASLLNQWESISDLKEICAQAWDHIEAFRHIISPKTCLLQPCFWILIYPITLYLFSLKFCAQRWYLYKSQGSTSCFLLEEFVSEWKFSHKASQWENFVTDISFEFDGLNKGRLFKCIKNKNTYTF